MISWVEVKHNCLYYSKIPSTESKDTAWLQTPITQLSSLATAIKLLNMHRNVPEIKALQADFILHGFIRSIKITCLYIYIHYIYVIPKNAMPLKKWKFLEKRELRKKKSFETGWKGYKSWQDKLNCSGVSPNLALVYLGSPLRRLHEAPRALIQHPLLVCLIYQSSSSE